MGSWLLVSQVLNEKEFEILIEVIVGLFQDYLMRYQLKTYSESEVGWIFSLYVFLSFFGGLQIGPIFDIKGPRMLLVAGSICLISGVILMGISTGTHLLSLWPYHH